MPPCACLNGVRAFAPLRKHKVPPLRFGPVGMAELLREGIARAEREGFIEEVDALTPDACPVDGDREASQTRDYCVAKYATHRAARPDPSLRKERLLGMTVKFPAQAKLERGTLKSGAL